MLFRVLSLFLFFTSLHAFAETPEWVNTVTLKGDMRLRHDFLKKESPASTPDRHRNQIRARLLTEAKPMDEVTVGIRIATGDSSNVITSNNTTMDEAGKDKAIWLDQAYILWMPHETSRILGGKMENPFYSSMKNQLIFDSDWTPEGAAGLYTWSNGLFLNWGAFWIEERSSGSENGGPSDSGLFGGQFGWSGEIGSSKLTVGGSEYSFAGLKGKPVINPSGSGSTAYTSRGNSSTVVSGATLYAKDFSIANVFMDLSYSRLGFYLDVAQNTSASRDNMAFLAGMRFGKIKERNDWMVSYSYRKTEKDAVVAGLKDSDFADGFNDSRGHTVAVRYALAPKNYVEIYASMADVEVSVDAKKTDRYMADLVMSF